MRARAVIKGQQNTAAVTAAGGVGGTSDELFALSCIENSPNRLLNLKFGLGSRTVPVWGQTVKRAACWGSPSLACLNELSFCQFPAIISLIQDTLGCTLVGQ